MGRGRGRVSLAVVAVGLALVVVGCGSSVDSSSSSSSADSASSAESAPLSAAAFQEAQAAVDPHLSRPTSLGITEPVKSVPKGTTVYFVYSAQPVSVNLVASARQAAQALGWKLKLQQVQQIPQAFQGGFENALHDPTTDAILTTSVPNSAISNQLAKAAARDIPVAIINADSPSTTDVISIGDGPAAYSYVGKLEAQYVLAKTRGRAEVLVAIAAALPTQQVLAKGFRDEWSRLCPKCKTPLTYDAPVTSLGKNFPALVTAYLQAHRSVDNIVFGFNDMMIGVPAALKAAGLGSVKAVTWAQGPETNSLIGGMLQADLALPLLEFPWVGMDAFLRVFNHQSTAQDSAFTGDGSPINWFLTREGMQKAGLGPDKLWPLDANYQEDFKKLWGLTK
jgi:ribose transport system substrate-binding protein